MFQHKTVLRTLAVTLAAVSVLSLSAMAAPTVTAVRMPASTSTSAEHAISATDSPVTVDPSQATGTFNVIYQNASGAETTAAITAVSPDDTLYASVNAWDSYLRVRHGPGTS